VVAALVGGTITATQLAFQFRSGYLQRIRRWSQRRQVSIWAEFTDVAQGQSQTGLRGAAGGRAAGRRAGPPRQLYGLRLGDIATVRRVGSNRSTIRSPRNCYLCLRNSPSEGWLANRSSEMFDRSAFASLRDAMADNLRLAPERRLAERVGFELSRLQWILYFTDSKVPRLPSMSPMPWRIARYCPAPEQ